MSVHDPGDWLVAYDIAEPRRGARVLKLLKRHGVPLQYSVFAVHATSARMQALMREIAGQIKPALDDVRAYRIPVGAPVHVLGAGSLPEGVLVTTCALLGGHGAAAEELRGRAVQRWARSLSG